MSEKIIYFAVKALILRDGKFLAMHKSEVKEDWLELPGGRMEFGETAEQTVIREINEETGLIVKPLRLLDTWNSVKEEYQITGIIYLCTTEKGEVRLSNEHDKFLWLDADSTTISNMHKVFKEKMISWNWGNIIME